jgi:phosphoribosylamine-glycine ligase
MVEMWDVMVPSRWFVVLTDDGTRIQARTYSLRNAVVMVQELLGDEAAVMAVWDGNNIYVIDWDS